jgi:two-component system, NarL family, nitrate/nitrite response regulator NarL
MDAWNVMLVDHDRLFAAALRTLIDRPPFRVIHAAADLAEATAAARGRVQPDLVVVALAGPVRDEAEAFRHLAEATDARVVVLTDGIAGRGLEFALRVGADAFLDKGASLESLMRSLQLVMLGKVVYPTRVADLLVIAPETAPAPEMGLAGDLSRREVQILRCLLAGQSNKAIARHLRITESTVKMHFKNVMRKINAQNRTQAAVWAINNGLSPLVSA